MVACKAKRLKHSTMLRYESILRTHLVPAFDGLRLHMIDRANLRHLVATMADAGAAAKTVHNVVRVLSAIFTLAMEDELVSHQPAGHPSKLMKIRKRRDALPVFTFEEKQVILAAAKELVPHYYPFILLLFRTGLREGEAVALQPGDLDLRSCYVLVQRNFTAGRLEESTKTDGSRKVDLSKDLVEALRGHLAMQEAEAIFQGKPRPRWVFTTPEGHMIRSNNFRDRIWRPLLKKLELRYRNVHATRHTFATHLILGGAKLVYVQRQLGHSSIKTTVDIYHHWLEEVDRGNRLEVDRVLEQEPTGSSPKPSPSGHPNTEVFDNYKCWGE